jgi:hypothetical protein
MRSRLFQLVAVLAIVLLLDHYSFDYTLLRQISVGLKTLVDATVQFCSEVFRVGILTDPVLQGWRRGSGWNLGWRSLRVFQPT